MRKTARETYKLGFTMVELLVVISIIGILSTLLFANFNAARERARDTQRKADLKNIQTSLRLYYNDFGQYPQSDDDLIQGCGSGTEECTWDGTSAFSTVNQIYMNTLPTDPSPDRVYKYNYIDDDNYTLKACLENRSDDKCDSTTEAWCNTDLEGCVYKVSP